MSEGDEDEAKNASDGFRVTRISISGPNGRVQSNEMDVEQAFRWMEEQTGYRRAEIVVEANLERIRNDIIEAWTEVVEKERAKLRNLGKESLASAENKIKQLLEDAEEVRVEMIPILNLVGSIRWDRDRKMEIERKEKADADARTALRKEMLRPGLVCGTCGQSIYDRGIAVNINYSRYLCAVCGEQIAGTSIIVKPDEKALHVETREPPAKALEAKGEKE